MPNRTYSPELKAQVTSEWLLGASVKGLAAKHKIPRTTIMRWTESIDRSLPVPQTAHEDLGLLVYEYLATGLKTLSSQARVMGDPEWFKRQGETAHYLHGVLADKLVIIFQGVENGQPEPDDVHTP